MSRPEPGRFVRNAQHRLYPLTGVLVILTGFLSLAANDWWWPSWLLVGLDLASLAWAFYARRHWPRE